VRSTVPRAVRAEESIGHNNEGQSVRPLPSSQSKSDLIPARHYRPNYQRQTGSEKGQRNRDSLVPKRMRNRATLFMRGNSVGDPTKRL
jgi:hypothetical protein